VSLVCGFGFLFCFFFSFLFLSVVCCGVGVLFFFFFVFFFLRPPDGKRLFFCCVSVTLLATRPSPLDALDHLKERIFVIICGLWVLPLVYGRCHPPLPLLSVLFLAGLSRNPSYGSPGLFRRRRFAVPSKSTPLGSNRPARSRV